MALVLEIPPEQEKQIRQAGVSLDTFVLESLMERLSRTQTPQSPNTLGYANRNKRQTLSVAETRLLEKINQSLSQIQWERYRALIAKRQAGTLTAEEQSELITLSDQIEEANQQQWGEHFAWSEDYTRIVPLTPMGRATVIKLELNRKGVVNLRRLLREKGLHPPV